MMRIVSAPSPLVRTGAALALAALLIAFAACDDDGAGPTRIGAGGTGPGANLTGTWTGGASDSLGQFQLTLVLTQSGSAVTGTMSGTTGAGAPVYSNGVVAGTVDGSTFTFAISIPPGGVFDDPSCSAAFAATTTDLLETSMAGTYTGSDTCGGTFIGGRFQLVKQ